MDRSVTTLDRFILEEERKHPEATGTFSSLLQDVALAAKLIHRAVSKAGLVDVLGETGATNVHGDRVRKLDEYAHDVVVAAMDHGGHLCVMASEESEELIPVPERFPLGDYVLLFDPLDGSGNIDANVSIGTIFSVHERVTPAGEPGAEEDCLQAGRRQAAAGYVLYGSSTMMVYSTGKGVHGFTLDPSIGEFVLSHPDLRIPEPGRRIYSVNEGHWDAWSEELRALVRELKTGRPPTIEGAHPGDEAVADEAAASGGEVSGFTGRYVGSLVADFHRTLLYGGLFMYPGNRRDPNGKLRLLYEAAPLAMLAEEAGGAASDGRRPILEIEPEGLHQRTPLFIGNEGYVELAEERLAAGAGAAR